MKPRMLIVDDEPEIAEVMSLRFERAGFETQYACSCMEALEAFEDDDTDFQIVLSDIRMPEMTGVDLLKELKASSKAMPPVVLMTGFTDVPEEVAFELGAKAIVKKPIDFDELKGIVSEIISRN